jgi:hypothetical protein
LNLIGGLNLPDTYEEELEDENSVRDGSYGGKSKSGGFDDWNENESVKDSLMDKSPRPGMV